METSQPPDGPSAYDSDFEAEKILEEYDPYIMALSWKKVPRNVVKPEMLADEIDELAQRVRFKLWLMLRKKHITNLGAYIRCIVFTEVIDMVRRYRLILPLPLDEDGELYQGDTMIIPSEEMQDPAYKIEREEAIQDYTQKIVQAVLRLSPRQQYAMICSLKDQIDDVLPIIHMLGNNALNIEKIHWPEEKDQLQSLRASLSIARNKLRSLQSKYP